MDRQGLKSVREYRNSNAPAAKAERFYVLYGTAEAVPYKDSRVPRQTLKPLLCFWLLRLDRLWKKFLLLVIPNPLLRVRNPSSIQVQ